jgi:MYXO-CTERM domain-containing protein
MKLDSRLNAHFATLRSSSVGSAVKRQACNWQLYATVTGSALAMASSASASVIWGGGPISTPTLSNVAASTTQGSGHGTLKNIPLKTIHGANAGTGFSFGVEQHLFATGVKTGSVFLKNTVNMGFLWTATHEKVDKLAAGVTISAHSPFATPIWEGTAPKLATSCVGACLSPPSSHNGWAKSAFGFAAFQFETAGGHKADYGWIQLEFTLGSNGLADGVTVEDWAYDNTGAPIKAGQTTSSSTPEPSRVAMALLAAGAAGVAALRRRRISARS